MGPASNPESARQFGRGRVAGDLEFQKPAESSAKSSPARYLQQRTGSRLLEKGEKLTGIPVRRPPPVEKIA